MDNTMIGPKSYMEVMVAPPPCEKFQCEHFNKCKTKFLACWSFQHYVITGRSVPPTVVGINGCLHPIYKNPKPTHTTFRKIYCEDSAHANTKRR